MEMCAGALIPRRTLSLPMRSTWISISFPIISFSSFLRVTTSINASTLSARAQIGMQFDHNRVEQIQTSVLLGQTDRRGGRAQKYTKVILRWLVPSNFPSDDAYRDRRPRLMPGASTVAIGLHSVSGTCP